MGAWLALHTTVGMSSTEITLDIFPNDLGKTEEIINFSDPPRHFKVFRKAGCRCDEKAARFGEGTVVDLPPVVMGHFNATM